MEGRGGEESEGKEYYAHHYNTTRALRSKTLRCRGRCGVGGVLIHIKALKNAIPYQSVVFTECV